MDELPTVLHIEDDNKVQQLFRSIVHSLMMGQ